MSDKRKVVFSPLATEMDKDGSKWKPSLEVCKLQHFITDQLVLLYPDESDKADLAVEVKRQIKDQSRKLGRIVSVKPIKYKINDPWDFEEVYCELYDIIRGFEFKTEREEYYMHVSAGTHVFRQCFDRLTYNRYFPGKLLQSIPPEVRRKGVDYRVVDTSPANFKRILKRLKTEETENAAFLKDKIQTKSKEYNHLIDQISKVATLADEPILLQGPTGTGKTKLAQKIFELKRRNNRVQGKFVKVNCATLRGDLAMSTLFGHKRGAFTGAVQDQIGLMQAADKGILFLDEIGELGLEEQAMLLSSIEEKEIIITGDSKTTPVNFQLIAGTNQDLKKNINIGKFRSDLLARIDLWSFELPALKDRQEDIAPNVEFELEQFRLLKNQNVRFDNSAKKRFLSFAMSHSTIWASNFRDLNAAIVRMSTLAKEGIIRTGDVQNEIDRLQKKWESSTIST